MPGKHYGRGSGYMNGSLTTRSNTGRGSAPVRRDGVKRSKPKRK